MLGRAHLASRTREGRIRPAFVDPAKPALLELAARLVGAAEASVGAPYEEAEEALLAAGHGAPGKLAGGLAKLVLDGCEVEAADAAHAERRARDLATAAAALRALPDGASRADYEAALAAALDRPLAEVRERLFADLPGRRRVLAVEPLDAPALLDRYNVALVQGLLLHAHRLELAVEDADVARVRRLLRRLRFHRLVLEVVSEKPLVLGVEGPGAVVGVQKGYGLQLASFFPAVVELARWSLVAELRLPRKPAAELRLDENAGLRVPPSPLPHLPEELRVAAEGLAAQGFEVHVEPAPRHVGVRGLAVPDLRVRHGGEELFVELFHRWHARPLARRLEDLAARPDGRWLLAVDRAIAEGVAEHPQVVRFAGFPAASRLGPALRRLAAKLG